MNVSHVAKFKILLCSSNVIALFQFEKPSLVSFINQRISTTSHFLKSSNLIFAYGSIYTMLWCNIIQPIHAAQPFQSHFGSLFYLQSPLISNSKGKKIHSITTKKKIANSSKLPFDWIK